MKQQERLPYSNTIWDEIETWPRERIEQFQLDALRRQLRRVADTSAHYRNVFAQAGFVPEDLKSLADLRGLPFTHKRDYLEGLRAAPPFGTLA
ncbi:phenylacetate--CoA ligase family protein, partial [Bordetella hinzii]|nr:phenylacetate--CoA ligase family protein [Bordetella hinzii]